MKRNPAIIIQDPFANRHNEFHGLFADGNKSQPRLYRIWRAMRCRCNSPNYDSYKDYGGRGIKVCPEWNSFTSFKAWALASGYSDSLTIDRKDVDGDYTPSNCRWSTSKEQSANKRNSCLVEINGVTKTVAQWAADTGIYINTLYRRYKRGVRGEDFIKPPTK